MGHQPKINVAYIITKLELGGAQKSTLNLADRIDSTKFQIHLISSCDGLLVDHAINSSHIIFYPMKDLKRNISFLSDIIALIRITLYLKKHNIKLVHTHSSKAGILGRWAAFFAGVPVIIHTIHGFAFHDFQPAMLRAAYALAERLTSAITTKLIAVSESDIRKGLANKIGSPDKYELIHCAIELDKFLKTRDTLAARALLGIGKDSKLVGIIACFKPQKNIIDFIKMARVIKNQTNKVKFLIVGDGHLRAHIAKLIDMFSLNDDIILLGWRDDIPQVMAALDVFVLSSLWEGLALVFLEALASGKPVVCTNVGGASEVVKDGINGYLVEPRDYKGLAERVIRIIDNDNRLQAMSINARDSIQSWFDIKVQARLTESLYTALLNLQVYDGRKFQARSNTFEQILK